MVVFQYVNASEAVTDEKDINIKTTVGVLIEGVDYFVSLKTKRVTDCIQPVSCSYRFDSVDPSLTLRWLLLAKFDMKIGRFHPRLMICRSERNPYCVV